MNYPNAFGQIVRGLAHGGHYEALEIPTSMVDGTFLIQDSCLQCNVCRLMVAVIAWNDGTLQTIHKMTWDSQNEFVGTMYYGFYRDCFL